MTIYLLRLRLPLGMTSVSLSLFCPTQLTPVQPVLTFINEIEYVWKRPWSWVSTLFVVVRYVGCFNAMVAAFFGSTIIPGPVIVRPIVLIADYQTDRNSSDVCIYPSTKRLQIDVDWEGVSLLVIAWNVHIISKISKGTVMNLINLWAFPLFLAASDLLMILRVYAVYNRSRRILAILLVIYIPAMVLSIADAAYIMTQKLYLTVVPDVADVRFCLSANNDIPYIQLSTYAVVARLVIGALLCVFAVAKFIRQSLEMHKALKQWRSDRYMKLFVRESILYFIANLLFQVVSYISNSRMPYIILGITVPFRP
ncbi:hypothetical protein BDN67DRAFT_1072034 [Paxillus ammoniavirescens]|nr:hypothetical protein BDN67DRAFT_1072034 [Paxillus ammoniavirescens]